MTEPPPINPCPCPSCPDRTMCSEGDHVDRCKIFDTWSKRSVARQDYQSRVEDNEAQTKVGCLLLVGCVVLGLAIWFFRWVGSS